jgi:hypothetical protein
MNNKLLSCLIATALGTTVALAPPAFARGGGGGGGGHGGGGGMHGGGMGGGGHFGGFGGGHFAGGSFGHGGFSPRGSRFAFHDGFHHRRFGFYGAPYGYAYYDGCWRQAWTAYGPQWINACGDYAYGY